MFSLFSLLRLTTLLIIKLTCGNQGTQASTLDLSTTVFDIRYPLIIDGNNASSNPNKAFGISVALSPGPPKTTDETFKTGWVFIGDPFENSFGNEVAKTGAIWRCSLGRKSEFCEKVNVDPKPKHSKTRDKASPGMEDEGGTWVGGDIQMKNGRLVTCGHRWTRGSKTYMNGICYFLPESMEGPQGLRSFQQTAINPVLSTSSGDYSHRLMPFLPLNPTATGISPKAEDVFPFQHGGKNDSGNEWGLGQAGMAIELLENSTNGLELLLGAPGVRMWSGAVVRYSDNPTTSPGQNIRLNRFLGDPSFVEMVVGYRGTQDPEEGNHWHDYFGYAVSSGKYFNTQEVLYSAGAPRASNLTGEVVIFSIPNGPPGTVKQNITVRVEIRPPPQAFGSYFGSVLMSVDLDGDGRDELIVGAPLFTAVKRSSVKRSVEMKVKDVNETIIHETEENADQQEWTGDHGCVFVYWFHKNSSIAKQQTVLGGNPPLPGGRFGSAISYLKLLQKRDNFTQSYIVVGAPYERNERGAIYLYKMDSTIHQLKFSHKITPEEVPGGAEMYGFGNSISLPIDIDGNETPDLAIGAFKSNTVVILRTRPTIKLLGTLDTKSIQREVVHAGQRLTLEICSSYVVETGLVRENLEIWTEIEVDLRLSIKSMSHADFVKDVVYGSSKLSNSKRLLVYKSNSTSACQKIQTILNSTGVYTTDEIPSPIRITLTLWYNETNDPTAKPVVYHIKEERQSQVHPSASWNFRNYSDDKPFPVSKTRFEYVFDVPPNDCRNPVKCMPELRLSYKWFDENDKNFSKPLSSYIIGSSSNVILRLTISNAGETAHKPRYEFWWNNNDIMLADDKVNYEWSVDECKNQSNDRNYNCTLLRNFIRNLRVRKDFKFDMGKVYAKQVSDSFTVYVRFFDDRGLNPVHLDAKLPLGILEKDTSVRIIGSRMSDTLKNPFIYNCTKLDFPKASESDIPVDRAAHIPEQLRLYSKFRHTYRVTLSGTRVREIQIKIKLPWGYTGNSETKSLLLIENPMDKRNVICDPIDQSHFYKIHSPGEGSGNKPIEEESSTSTPVVNRRKRDVAGEPKRVYENVSNSNITDVFQDDEETLDDNKTPNAKSEFIVKQEDFEVKENALHINCNDEIMGDERKWNCMELDCFAYDVSSYVEIHFDMYFVQKAIDELMEDMGKTEVLVESSGMVEIIFPDKEDDFNDQFTDKDKAQTMIDIVMGDVYWWVYLIAVLFGILLLSLLTFILYKCGFFKREEKVRLINAKKEHHARKSSMVPAHIRVGSYVEMADQPDDDPEPPVQTKKNSLGEVVEHL